jgi:hypothetical protein
MYNIDPKRNVQIGASRLADKTRDGEALLQAELKGIMRDLNPETAHLKEMVEEAGPQALLNQLGRAELNPEKTRLTGMVREAGPQRLLDRLGELDVDPAQIASKTPGQRTETQVPPKLQHMKNPDPKYQNTAAQELLAQNFESELRSRLSPLVTEREDFNRPGAGRKNRMH